MRASRLLSLLLLLQARGRMTAQQLADELESLAGRYFPTDPGGAPKVGHTRKA